MFSLSKSLDELAVASRMVGCGHEMLSRESTSYPVWVGGAGAVRKLRKVKVVKELTPRSMQE